MNPLRTGATIFAFCLLGASLPPPAMPSFDPQPYETPKMLVDIGHGRHLNMYCSGTGGPTVILDSGLGGWTLNWRYTQPLVATFSHVCSFDRAGYGFSDPGPLPRSTNAIVNDLHTALGRVKIAPPYILVGHSMGGFDMRMFAYRYPSEVSGMVLVDPEAEGQDKYVDAILPKVSEQNHADDLMMGKCAKMARDGLLKRASVAPNPCLPPPNPQFSVGLNDAIAKQLEREGAWTNLLSEDTSSRTVDETQLRRAQRSYGNVPLIVLTAGDQANVFKLAFGATKAQVSEIQSAWEKMHDAQAAFSHRGVNCIIPGVGHNIMIEKPNVVAAAIREAIAASRAGTVLSCENL